MSIATPPSPIPAHDPAESLAPTRGPLHGVLIEYETEEEVVEAVGKAREAGYTEFDAHSPYPIHGIDDVAGIKMTNLGWLVFAAGCSGALIGLLLQWWTNSTNPVDFPWVSENVPNFLQGYSYRISGKPFFSLPAFIPVIFELTILLSAFAAVFGMLALNNLPWFYNPWFTSRRFLRATDDRFFVSLPASDPRFELASAKTFATQTGGTAEEIYDVQTPALPRWVPWVGATVLSLMVLIAARVAYARVDGSTEPRIHPIQDMDNQPRFKTQQANLAFSDGRAMRREVDGTVARGDYPIDRHMHEGVQMFRQVKDDEGNDALEAVYFQTPPPSIQITMETLERGRERYDIFCAMCHGLDARGNGIVHQRATSLAVPPNNLYPSGLTKIANWVQPTNLLGQTTRERADGEIFDAITHGIRSMSAYGHVIPPEDRWAIVLYVRALQRAGLEYQLQLEGVPIESVAPESASTATEQ